MRLHQFGLKPLKITDRSIIDGILCSRQTMLSAYAFATHYIWRDIFHFYWGILHDHLCLFARYNDYLSMPLPPVPCHPSSDVIAGDKVPEGIGARRVTLSDAKAVLALSEAKKFHKIIPTAFSIMEKTNKNKAASRIENIDEAQIEDFVSMGYSIRSEEGEYVYLRKDLANLRGDRYKAKRAMCNHFAKQYRYSYEPFQPSLAGDCLRLYNEWKRKKGMKITDPFYHALLDDSSFAHKKVMRHCKSLQLTGRVVRINERVEGYLFGFGRKGDIFYILMEITNPDIRGLAQFIFREFCREVAGYTYINTLGDSGLDNLRRVKLSYRPFKIVPSYIAYRV